MGIKATILAITACAGLAACGDTIGEQAVGGGAVGAAAAVVTSGSILQGAAIGAAGNIAYCQAYPHKCN
ncbi:MAG: hypothetical protein WBC93_09735 [Sulfitobacter sp.]